MSLKSFKNRASKLTADQMKQVKGGSDYCDTILTIMQGAYHRGDLELVQEGADLWGQHCT